MITLKAQSAGGVARAKQLIKKVTDEYESNPNYCLNCNIKIEIDGRKVREVRICKFCSKTCAATFNNKKRIKKIKVTKVKKSSYDYLKNKTKKEIFDLHKNWQSARTSIRRHAALIFKSKNIKSCQKCGYDKHIEICHIKSVSSFEDHCKIEEINSSDNLMGLCPNCHWEFDNISGVGEVVTR